MFVGDARQRALNEWILGNGNLWTGQRSLLVGHSHESISRQIKDRRRNMGQTVYSPHKGRLETQLGLMIMKKSLKG